MCSLAQCLSNEAAADFLRLSAAAPESGADIRKVAPTFADAVVSLRDIVEDKKFVVINALPICNTKEEFRKFCLAVGMILGELAVQNAEGAKIVEVYDRRIGRISDGVRYHQTRQGGDIHTDSVNHPVPFRYFLLGCVAPAQLGGESILVLAADVQSALATVPQALVTLRNLFWFEGRGMGDAVGFFQVPVLSDQDGIPRFRYLRSYIEAAHAKVGQPLTSDQGFAFDALDAVLDSSAIQRRFTLGRGDVLICLDAEVFHGRTAFVDSAAVGAWAPHRLMFRLWVKHAGTE
jgi:Taurine catabolism dioxygenase TauD, TfdA family